MPHLNSLADAEAALEPYVPVVKAITGKDIAVERLKTLLATIGNPHQRLRIVHVAGTSGKTSTAYYLARLLQSSGHRVGLTISPHLDSITERVQMNGLPLDDTTFCSELGEFLDLIADFDPMPSYFEVMIAFAFWYFDRQNVDYAVIETGVGGIFDCTNVAERPDKVCVITDIGLDHMHILGKTEEAIAAQKAGIMHAGNAAFMYAQKPAVTKVVADYATRIGADLRLQELQELAARFNPTERSALPAYQQRNWLLACATADYVSQRDGWSLTAADITASLQTRVPGRMEISRHDTKTVIMDGAHNQQKMVAFVESFRQQYPGARVPVMIAMKQGKEYETVLPLLLPICSQLIITSFEGLNGLPSQPADPSEMAAVAKNLGFTEVTILPDPAQALDFMLALPDQLLAVTGSFYLLARIRELKQFTKQG